MWQHKSVHSIHWPISDPVLITRAVDRGGIYSLLVDTQRSNESILKEISPGCSLEGLMLKLKLQNFGHLMRKVDSLEKTLILGGIGAGGEGDDRG